MDLEAKLGAIAALPHAALQQRWRKHYRRAPPAALPPKLMREAFLYAVQEDAFGGLSPKTKRRLDLLFARIEADPTASLVGDGALRPGARLVREWRGTRHEVEILEEGFGYEGKTYASLSEIARVITGTRWSGPRFFGLKQGLRA